MLRTVLFEKEREFLYKQMFPMKLFGVCLLLTLMLCCLIMEAICYTLAHLSLLSFILCSLIKSFIGYSIVL